MNPLKPRESERIVPRRQSIDGYALARHMGILNRPFLVDFDVHTAPWSWRKDRYSARQLAALWRKQLRRADVSADFPAAVYIHIPFCTHTCGFCRCFRLRLRRDRSLLDRYTGYICDQMDFFAPVFRSVPIRYFSAGGGTPSILSARHWRRILSRLHERYDVRHDSPLTTFEMSLPTMRDDLMRLLAEFKVPRVSVGVQTLSPGIRRANRMFDIEPQRLAERVAAAKRIGLRVNLDLVLGLPGESAARFLGGFGTLLEMEPDSVCVNIRHQNYLSPTPGPTGAAGYLRTVGEGMARAAARAGYLVYPHANHIEEVLFLSRDFDRAVRPHWDIYKRLAGAEFSVKVGTSVFAFGSICTLALLPDYLISCFDQDYRFDPDKVVYQCSRKEVFSILYPRPEDAGPVFGPGQRRMLEPALRRLRTVRGLDVMPSLDDVLLEFSDPGQEDKRGRVFIRPYAKGRPCSQQVGPLALTYNGALSPATERVLAAARRSLEAALAGLRAAPG